jgi:hypothetical protein
MADNRYLEIIKRLLTAENYFRSREEANGREPGQSGPEKKPR